MNKGARSASVSPRQIFVCRQQPETIAEGLRGVIMVPGVCPGGTHGLERKDSFGLVTCWLPGCSDSTEQENQLQQLAR